MTPVFYVEFARCPGCHKITIRDVLSPDGTCTRSECPVGRTTGKENCDE